jgi:pimeloyl-ACP methyl ester carboxylesterase
MVLPGVAAFTRACAYDRPGTLREVNPRLEPNGAPFVPSRSTPVHQPRTTRDKVADLHALLEAAKIPGPYVLVGHSAGGLVSRLYASTYPDDVAGMVLVDSTPENVWLRFHSALPPDQWKTFEALTVRNQELLDAYPESEQWWTAPLVDDASTRQVREAGARTRMRPIPLFVLVHGKPFPAPFSGWPTDNMEKIMSDLQTDLRRMTPDGKIVIARKSGHDIHQDQPELVIAAIRQVVDAVRNPKTWKAAPMPAQ